MKKLALAMLALAAFVLGESVLPTVAQAGHFRLRRGSCQTQRGWQRSCRTLRRASHIRATPCGTSVPAGGCTTGWYGAQAGTTQPAAVVMPCQPHSGQAMAPQHWQSTGPQQSAPAIPTQNNSEWDTMSDDQLPQAPSTDRFPVGSPSDQTARQPSVVPPTPSANTGNSNSSN